MAYGLKYVCDFDRIGGAYPEYTLNIYQKDFDGYETEVTGSAIPVSHAYDTDEPKAPIKGSSLSISLINESGNITLQDLYSADDEEFKAELIWHGPTDQTLFVGFVVQDDSSELMVDYNHEIQISANDNLGLLKDIPFNTAPYQNFQIFTTESVSVEGVAPHTLVVTDIDAIIEVGDVLSTTGTLTGVYHVTGVDGDNISVQETVTDEAVETVTMIVFRADLLTFQSLLSIIHTCLSGTGLELNTRVFANINESTQDSNTCFLEQTFINPQTFHNGDTWDDCYNVLEKVLGRFGLTLFQAKGVWNIVRWNELRYYDYNIPGHEYDSDFAHVGTVTLEEGFDKFQVGIEQDTQAETGLTQRITRPFKYVKETFNYQQPDEMLRNADFQQLGNLVNEFLDGGGNTVSEYDAPWWFYTDAYPTESGVNGPAVYFIRVIRDPLGNELERYLVVKDNSVHSYDIEANAGDVVRFSFSGLTREDFATINLIIKLTDGSSTVFAQELGSNPSWDTTTGYGVTVGITADEWFSVDVETAMIPFDGLLTVYLQAFSSVGAGENFFRDVRLEYIARINQSTKIIAHTHKSLQESTTKNIDEKEIFLDSSPRNFIAGTLFLESTTGVLRDRCDTWSRATAPYEDLKLGHIITFEELFLRKEARTLLEGNFFGLLSGENHLSLLSVLRYTYFPTHNFIFGKLEIDYRNNMASATLYEMYKDNEADIDLSYNYIFNYLYDTQ